MVREEEIKKSDFKEKSSSLQVCSLTTEVDKFEMQWQFDLILIKLSVFYCENATAMIK